MSGLPQSEKFAFAVFMIGLVVLGVVIELYAMWRRLHETDLVHLRGAKFVGQDEAGSRAAEFADARARDHPGPGWIAWGGILLPIDEVAWTHFLFQGRPGSGKTVLIKAFLESILPQVGTGEGYRVILANPKRKWGAIAHTLVPSHVPIWNLNPFDLIHGNSWATGMDVLTSAEAEQLTDMLIPESDSDHNPYFRNVARITLRGLIVVLQSIAAGRWTLRDLILLTQTVDVLREVLKLDPSTRRIVSQHFMVEKVALDIVSTLGSLLGKFEVIAACWHHAPRAVSLRRFLDREEVIILGYDDAISVPLMSIYPLLLKFIEGWKNAQNDGGKPLFTIIDEARLFGKCDLTNMVLKGREAKASLMIAFHDINGMEAVLGEKEARELCGNILSKALLGVESEEAAKFASESLGKYEAKETRINVTEAVSSGSSRTRVEQVVQRELVMPDEFRDLPQASWAAGVAEGFFKTPISGRFRAKVPFRDVVERLSPSHAYPKYVQRPAEQQRLATLGLADLKRLNIPMSPAIQAAIIHGA